MRLLSKCLLLWSCWGLTRTMEEPRARATATPYAYLYSDVDACTRYNFLPINAKNFREAILFFNLCRQLVHILPEDQRKDYARYLKHEIVRTRNEFRSKNDDEEIGEWLDSKISTLLQELNKEQPDNGDKSDHATRFLVPQFPLGRTHYWRKSNAKTECTLRNTPKTTARDEGGEMTARPPMYEDLDQEELLAGEEKVNVNDVALIGLILGLVSTISAALTLMYICYCTTKRTKKKVSCSNHRKERKDDDKERLMDQPQTSGCSNRDSQISTKIAKYASGECKVNKSEGCMSHYQSFDAKRPSETDNKKAHAAGSYGNTKYETGPDYEGGHEKVSWDGRIMAEAEGATYPVHLENAQEGNMTVSHHSHSAGFNEQGYPMNDCTYHPIVGEQHQSDYNSISPMEVDKRTMSKEVYGDSDEAQTNVAVFPQEKVSRISTGKPTGVDMREAHNLNFSQEDPKTGPPLTYIQQKYSKGQVPLMNSHFSCDVQRQTLQPRLYVQQVSAQLQLHPTPEHVQQPELQQEVQVEGCENNQAVDMNVKVDEKGQLPPSGTNLLPSGNQEIKKCQNCNKRMLPKKRTGFTCENEGALTRARTSAVKGTSDLEKTSAPCTLTESENILRQERFLCSLSATTPLTMQEQYFKPDRSPPDTQEKVDQGCPDVLETKNTQPPSDDLIGDAQSLMNKNDIRLAEQELRKIAEQRNFYKTLHSPIHKKYHRQKGAYPKFPLVNKQVQEINSSYYSVKPGAPSPYQSCAQVDPLLSSKLDLGLSTTNEVLTSKNQQKDFQKKIKTVFSRNTPRVKEGGEERLIVR